jgi:hypothetical protein
MTGALRTSQSLDAPQVWRSESGYDRPLWRKLAITSHSHLPLQKSELPPADVGPPLFPVGHFPAIRAIRASLARKNSPHLPFRILHEKSCAGSCGGSVGLAAQEGRDIENVFLDQMTRGRGATVRIEALRSRAARIFRIRVCRLPFGVSGRREDRRTR